MDWYELSQKYHTQTFDHDAALSSLPEEWQRELAALWRLEADVNGGGYLSFLANWGRESYVYASQALKKIGAQKMATIIDRCQAIVDEHYREDGRDRRVLLPNKIINIEGKVVKKAGSVLPASAVDRILELSYEFMDYPDEIDSLGMAYYQRFHPAE